MADDEYAILPILVRGALVQADKPVCRPDGVAEVLCELYENKEFRYETALKGFQAAQIFGRVAKENKFGNFIDEVLAKKAEEEKVVPERKDKVLYMQYETAGDVLLASGVIKGLSEKHNAKVDYMTSPAYMEMLEENPWISEVVPWNLEVAKQYKMSVYPHKAVRPGNWGTNDVHLSQVYAQLCDVAYVNPVLIPKEPKNINLPGEPFITIHNAGGHPFRTYLTFDDMIADGLPIKTVQIGGVNDPKIEKVDVDLRGKTSWRETAYVMDKAMFHVGVDSFPGHAAAALGKKMIILYGPGAHRVIHPLGDQIPIMPNYITKCPILGPCWGNYASCDAPCIRSIAPSVVRIVLLELLAGIKDGKDQTNILKSIKREIEKGDKRFVVATEPV
jgi:hypothetical protein